jgi:antirestriction protein ArdC
MKTERFDIHQHITDKIVNAIERGAGDFRLPWHRSAGSIMRPVNIASKKAYHGVNILALCESARDSAVKPSQRRQILTNSNSARNEDVRNYL